MFQDEKTSLLHYVRSAKIARLLVQGDFRNPFDKTPLHALIPLL